MFFDNLCLASLSKRHKSSQSQFYWLTKNWLQSNKLKDLNRCYQILEFAFSLPKNLDCSLVAIVLKQCFGVQSKYVTFCSTIYKILWKAVELTLRYLIRVLYFLFFLREKNSLNVFHLHIRKKCLVSTSNENMSHLHGYQILHSYQGPYSMVSLDPTKM